MLLHKLSLFVVLLIPFSFGQSLMCNEGFNVSVSGIPFYFWAEHDCKGKSECFMQEISYEMPEANLRDVVLRYGGCVSKNLASYMSCEGLYGEDSNLTLDIAFDILQGLDSRRMPFLLDVAEIMTGRDSGFGRLFSRGKGPEEFLSGIPDFLESIGYKRSNLERVMTNFYLEFDKDDIIANFNKLLTLIEAAEVKNGATTKLSLAAKQLLRKFLGTDSYEFVIMELYCKYVPGLIYPILTQYLDGVDETYYAIANGLENLEKNRMEASVPEEHQENFFLTLRLILLVGSKFEPSEMYKLYKMMKNTLESYKVQDHSDLIDDNLRSIDIIFETSQKLASLPSCEVDDFACKQENILRKYQIEWQRNWELFRSYRRSNRIDVNSASGIRKNLELINIFYEEAMVQWMKLSQDKGELEFTLLSPLTEIFDR